MTKDRYQNTRYYCIGDSNVSTPKDREIQLPSYVNRKHYLNTATCVNVFNFVENTKEKQILFDERETILEDINPGDAVTSKEIEEEMNDPIIDKENINIQVKQADYTITSIDRDREWTNIIILHVKECPKSELYVFENIYELIDVYTCKFCGKD